MLFQAGVDSSAHLTDCASISRFEMAEHRDIILTVGGGSVAETRIELTGWKAIVAVLVVVAITGVRMSMRFPAIPDEGREALRTWLVKDYEGLGPRALARMARDYRAGLPVQAPDPPAEAPEVEFVSLHAHGLHDGMVVRAEVSVNGGSPPDDRSVRYLFLTTKFDGGWMVMAEATKLNYYEALVGWRPPR